MKEFAVVSFFFLREEGGGGFLVENLFSPENIMRHLCLSVGNYYKFIHRRG